MERGGKDDPLVVLEDVVREVPVRRTSDTIQEKVRRVVKMSSSGCKGRRRGREGKGKMK